jgi:polyisoprenoid-binding protein YceI
MRIAAAALALLAGAAVAQESKPAAYHFGAAAKHTNITFVSETSVETIHGVTHAVTGKAVLDFGKGEGSAELAIPVTSLDTGIPTRNEHLQSDKWMDAAKHPDIVFKAKSLKREKADEKTGKETWSYEGDMTIHGVTKAMKGEASVQRIPADLSKVLGPGEWIKVKASFDVTLADFDVKIPEGVGPKVSATWTVGVDIYGTTEVPEKKAK